MIQYFRRFKNKIATPLPLNLAPNYNYTGCIMRGSWPNSMKTHFNEIKFNENTMIGILMIGEKEWNAWNSN